MELPVIVSILAGISGIALGWAGRAKQAKQEVKTEAEKDITSRVDIEYIKRGVDNIQLDIRELNKKK